MKADLIFLFSLFILASCGNPSLAAYPPDAVLTRASLADLAETIAAREAAWKDLRPGAEKEILWAGKPGEKTAYSVVYIHGLAACRQETAPLADEIAKRLGANLFYTRLTGHGLPPRYLGEATRGDWYRDAADALAVGKALGDRVILVGTSTGATLVTWLLERYGADVSAAVLLSPNFTPKNGSAELLTIPVLNQVIRAVVLGDTYRIHPKNYSNGVFWTTNYPSRTLIEMMLMVKEVREGDLARVSAPVLVLYNPKDNVVNEGRTREIFPKFVHSRYKEIVEITNATDPHVIAGDIMSPESTATIRDLVLEFIRKGK
jgi:pimeloyl-ACP methyl ester carboxylesterase